MRVFDVILATTDSVPARSQDPPVRDRVELGSRLWIGRLDQGLGRAVMDACDPAGLEYRPSRLFGERCSLVLEDPPNPQEDRWDPERRLSTALALSRLIRPTSTGTEYSARVFVDDENRPKRIVPGAPSGPLARAFVGRDGLGQWLTPGDALQLRSLIASFEQASSTLPPRVRRALWNHECACCTSWTEVRWTIIATALEAMIHTDRHASTKQFVERVSAVADAVGVVFSEGDADRAYGFRSSLAHGQGLSADPRLSDPLLISMETVLRQSVRRCIEDEGFRAIFESDAEIRRVFGRAGK